MIKWPDEWTEEREHKTWM